MPLPAELIHRLTEIELPGVRAHRKVMSYARDAAAEVRAGQMAYREGAVLILIYPSQGVPHVVFILRPEYDGVHSRQVAFPGGEREAEDHDLEETALREAYEEVAIEPSKVRIVRHLTEVYIPPSNFIVRPVLGITSERPLFIPQQEEVDRVLEYPLEAFLNETAITRANVLAGNGLQMEVGAFQPGEHVIWGATAMMLAEMRNMMMQ